MSLLLPKAAWILPHRMEQEVDYGGDLKINSGMYSERILTGQGLEDIYSFLVKSGAYKETGRITS